MANGWGGAREGAGRKPLLAHKTGSEIVNLSAEISMKALRGELKLEDYQLADLAKQFVIKAMPQRVEAEGMESHQNLTMIIPGIKEIPEEIQKRISELNGGESK